jgi:hypothetical protein
MLLLLLRRSRGLGLGRVAGRLCLLMLRLWLLLLLLWWITVLLAPCRRRARRSAAVEGLPVVDGRVIVACGQLLWAEALGSTDGHAVQI